MASSFIQDVTACLGDEIASYASRKRSGGDSGRKGIQYEDLYAAHCLAEAARDAITGDNSVCWPTLEVQADAMVDDLVLSWSDRTCYYQCKNVDAISWTSGRHSPQDDFAYQVILSSYQGKPRPKTLLVVPSNALVCTLKSTMPAAIAQHSDVIEFPYCNGSMNRLVLEFAPLRSCLADLARVDAPTDDEIANVLGALLHGIRKHDGNGPSDLMFKAAQSAMPQLVRLLPGQMARFKYVESFEATLATISGLKYGITRGFFHWEGFGTSSVFRSNCFSEEFAAYQQRIVQASPQTFDEFEVLT